MAPAVPVQVGVTERPTLAPAKWSPSSAVMTNSVLLLLMPSSASRWKKVANALLYATRFAW